MTPNAERYLRLVRQSREMVPDSHELEQVLEELDELWFDVLSEDERFWVERQLDLEDMESKP